MLIQYRPNYMSSDNYYVNEQNKLNEMLNKNWLKTIPNEAKTLG